MQRLNRWLIAISLFLLPWQAHFLLRAGELNGAWEYGSIRIFAIDCIILVAIALTLIASRGAARRSSNPLYRYGMIIMLAYLAISLPFSLLPSLSAFRFASILVAALYLFILSQSDIPWRTATLSFIAGACWSSLLGIWQFATQTTFASTWLGVASHRPSELGVSVIEALAPDGRIERWLRAYGSLDHPNMLGAVAAISLIFVAWLWISRRRDGRFENIILAVATVSLAGGLIVSFSRAAWIAAAVGLLIIVICRFKQNWKQLGSFFLISAIVAGLFASQYYYLFAPRLGAENRLEEKSSTERITGIKESVAEIMKRPVFGSGLGTYTLARSQSDPDKEAWNYQPVHNVFLLIAAETGIVGLLLILGTIIAFLGFSIRRSPASSRPLIFALAAAIIASALLDHWLWSLHFGIIFSAALFGLAGRLTREEVLTDAKARYTVTT